MGDKKRVIKDPIRDLIDPFRKTSFHESTRCSGVFSCQKHKASPEFSLIKVEPLKICDPRDRYFISFSVWESYVPHILYSELSSMTMHSDPLHHSCAQGSTPWIDVGTIHSLSILALRQIMLTNSLVEVAVGSQTMSRDGLTDFCCDIMLLLIQCYFHASLMQTIYTNAS